MGWLWLFVIGAAALLALRMLGIRRAWLQLSAAALLIGGVGYAFQHNASLAGQPAQARAKATGLDPGLVAFRAAIMPADAGNRVALSAADFRLGNGDVTGASQVLLDAIRRRPDDAALWTRLGSVIAEHDGGQVSPAAQFAFRRAAALAPQAPGPPFFLGLALVQSGDLAAAREAWARTFALTPAVAPYRVALAERIALIDRVLASKASNSPPP
ncbi:cytochrome C biosynthesis protein [Sphingomonas lutea]|uniref:Cytochrome C biosynthesis protein n=1 Tax=Sphingomonas lutea TaxID=1045317 RepID=A0A7G9SJU1_9SPHN|nr:cytochrome C biosynthesis protein [Sphingomonas lutea]QNN68116.1 cytochrome C biosynthesis protein [Sphingomonas lutea]